MASVLSKTREGYETKMNERRGGPQVDHLYAREGVASSEKSDQPRYVCRTCVE